VGVAGLLSLAASLHAQVPGISSLCEDSPAARGEAVTTLSPTSGGNTRLANRAPKPATDLFCLDLFATAAGGEASGVAELRRVTSPFGVAVSADGAPEQHLVAWIDGLPDPAQVGDFTSYIAWITTPVLDPMIKLGTVRNGENDLGIVTLNKFMLMVTAEESADVTERNGRLVLRGRSPSMRMAGHDLLAEAPSAVQAPSMATHAHGDNGWTAPPMYPGIEMLPGMMALTPEIRPLLPTVDTIDALPNRREREVVTLPNGGTLDLEAGFVRRTIHGRALVMLAFNGQHPGPLIRVPHDATITVNFTNNTPFPTAIHWHGVRLDNRFDGVPGVTQEPVEPGATFTYRVHFRDAGIYWYHPHHREDVQQELGLFGNMLVDPEDPDDYGPVNREQIVMLDDLLLASDGIVPFGNDASNFTLMGRFGNVFLVNGEPRYELDVARGEVVRFYFTNVSNTRTFNVSFVERDGDSTIVPLKVVASDVGRFERQEMTDHVTIAPAERYVVEARFAEAGEYAFVNRVQAVNHRLGTFFPEVTELGGVTVASQPAAPDYAPAFEDLRVHEDVVAEIDPYREHFDRAPDKELVLTLETEGIPLPIEQAMQFERVYFNPMEWAGTMPMMNWVSTGRQVTWVLRDPATGNENMDIVWRFQVGDVVRMRVHNDRNAFHAMQHPLHIHGQRFLVLEQNGVPNDNLVWKDTALLPVGSTTELLLEISNPGRWMVHCHIAEHLESGMKFVFDAGSNN
jgi:FtsP/CotA-like multicopper oxidase with cupredoxin domain